MGRLDGKAAIITGAGAGIARAAALVFAREGAKVAVIEIDRERGRKTAADVADAGGQAIFIEADVTNDTSVARAIAETVERFGKLDVLYNCAGGSASDDDLVTDVNLDVVQRTLALNLMSPILCSRHALPHLIRAGGGAIVNMSSGAALRGSSPAHSYTAAKGGVVSLTRALAGAYAKHNIRVNVICAGRILTERITSRYGSADQPGPVVDRQDASGRVKEYPFWVGKPEDIANVALFLASDESRMITGATIAADGGRSAY